MDEPHDIANELIRESYLTKSRVESMSKRPAASLRRAIANAKRFMLDASMSTFMAELAKVPFRVAPERRPDVLSSLRHSARLPFPSVFIQYDGLAYQRGLYEAFLASPKQWGEPQTPPDPTRTIADRAWLCENDPSDPDLVWISTFVVVDKKVATVPFRYAYRTDDRGFHPRLQVDTAAGMLGHGMSGLLDANIGVRYAKSIQSFPRTELLDVVDTECGLIPTFQAHSLVQDFGCVCEVLALLATLNHIPKIETQVRPAKSFIAGAQVRQYLDHTTLRIELPAHTSLRTLAKRLIAKARRGWHQVRPHWRIYHHGEKFCASHDAHIWLEANETGHANCKLCDARRVWIVLPNGRGDPMISIRTHKYVLTHSQE